MNLYERFFKYIYRNLQYIIDFSNISITTYNISSIFQIYLSQLTIYHRFFKYIYHNLQYIIDLPTNISTLKMRLLFLPPTPQFLKFVADSPLHKSA
ncbi:hypothetical protein F8510_16665 [Bacillus sp. RM2(2019)]|nr:hypothetical protein F8510_16665 [Bacillus sp. RM2(2019)]OTZ49712.1 hypothetical protein BK762_15160 [Bacillus thuringiensis serovar toumanoffi]RFB61196.1 hypothetical protein DZB90_09170 [Bacillus thuringiensis]